MKVGTKSVIGGAHCFLLHPFFVAWGWARLFGFPLRRSPVVCLRSARHRIRWLRRHGWSER